MIRKILVAAGIVLLGAVAYTQFNTLVHMEQGGGQLSVESGGTVEVKSGGTETVDSGASLDVTAVSIHPSSLTVTNAATFSGTVALPSETTTQLSTLVPVTTGQVVFNSTYNRIDVSSGIGAGAWVTHTSSTAVVPAYP